MEIHTMKAEQVPEFCKEKNTAVCLLLTGLAEINSNAISCGGLQTESFKIKWKQINKRGMAICKFLFEN